MHSPRLAPCLQTTTSILASARVLGAEASTPMQVSTLRCSKSSCCVPAVESLQVVSDGIQAQSKDVRQAAKHMRSFATEDWSQAAQWQCVSRVLELSLVHMVYWQSVSMPASASQHLLLQSLVCTHPRKPSQAPRGCLVSADINSTHSSGRSRKSPYGTFLR